jgi:peptidoglycan/xylan/chitin deacetylase (PgdA/CDA1 family)
VASGDERRRAIVARRRRVRLQRRALAVAAVLALVVVVVAIAAGGGGNAHSGAAVDPRSVPGLLHPPRPAVVDRVLGYTDYVLAGSRRRREVALTFDDGPSRFTPRLVKELHRRHAAATFFPVGQPIDAYPHNLRLEHRRGFPIGDHTMTHPLLARLPRETQATELDEQAQLLTRAGVPYPRLFRPPYGSFDADTLALLGERRMLMVLWSVNPEDYYRPGTEAIVARVLAAVRPGSIVLMHDGGGDRTQTVAAVPKIVRMLRRRHYKLVTIPRLLRDDPPPRGQGPPPNLAGI